MHAVLADRNQQHRVAAGDRLLIDLDASLEPGAEITFDKICFVGGDEPKIGDPFVEGASVTAKVLRQEVKGPKMVVQKFKRRKNYRRRIGFRARYTEILIEAIKA